MAKGAPGSPGATAAPSAAGPAPLPSQAGAAPIPNAALAQALGGMPAVSPQPRPQQSGPVPWWLQPNVPQRQRPSPAPAAPAAPALPGSPGAAGTWQAQHSGVRFDMDGQPILPAPTAKTKWFGGGMGYDGSDPGYQAYMKAYSDPKRPMVQGPGPFWNGDDGVID
jgi:hypothetical protein